MMPERPTETRDLEEQIRDHYRKEAQTIPTDPDLWERLALRLAPRPRRGRALIQLRGLPLAVLATAAALVLVAGSVFWISQGRTESPLVPSFLLPTTAPAPMPPAAPTAFPGAEMPAPDLEPKPPYEVVDQGVRLAVLRTIVNPGHVTAFFFVVDGPADLAGWTIMPDDPRVQDQEGAPYTSHLTHVASVADVTVGAVGIGPLRPKSTDLTLLVTTFRATSPSGQARTIHGGWQIHLLRNLQSVSIHPDSLVDMPYIACFQSKGVRVGSSYYDPCAKPAIAPTLMPAARPVVPPKVEAPFPGAVRTATSIPADQVAAVPVTAAPTRPPAPTVAPTPLIPITSTAVPTPLAPSGPPQVVPTHLVTPAVPLPTATPARLVGGEFTDWRHGLFGIALTLSAPHPHRVYVLVKPDGTVEAVSEAAFEAARNER